MAGSGNVEAEIASHRSRAAGIGFVPYSPLGRGFLTGTIKKSDLGAADARSQRYPRFAGENFDKNAALVERVKEIAESKGVTAGQLALAWVLAEGEDMSSNPRHETLRRYLEKRMPQLSISNWPRKISKSWKLAVPLAEIAGDHRYAEANMKAIDR